MEDIEDVIRSAVTVRSPGRVRVTMWKGLKRNEDVFCGDSFVPGMF